MQYIPPTPTTPRFATKVYKAGHTVITKECDGKLCLDRYAFDNFLDKSNIGDKAFSIISISGPAREGKSFMMNLVLRYFDKEEWQVHNRTTTDDGIYKMNAFKVDSSPACVTTGIRLYNHTFEVKYNEKPMVIILMDTQGIFDGYSGKRNDIFLLTLTTLMSSVQICNTSRNVNMALFGALNTAIRYGELAANKERFLKLQDLFFLLRDQMNSRQIMFDHLMKNEQLSGENKVIRDKIRKTFTDVDLFCLPTPGRTVILLSGDVMEIKKEDIGEEFLAAAQAFLTSTISPLGRLKPKHTNGEAPIKLRELLKLLILCDVMFKKIPVDGPIDPGKIMEANERVAYEDQYEQAYKQFSDKIQSISGESLAIIETSYETLSTEILENFNKRVSQWEEASEEGKKQEEIYRNKLLQNMEICISGKVDAWKIQEETRQLNLRLKSEGLYDQYAKSVKNCATVNELDSKTKTFKSKIIKETSETKYDRKKFEQLLDTKYEEMKQLIKEREEEEKKAKILRQQMFEHEVNKLHDEFKIKIRMVEGTTKETIRKLSTAVSTEMLKMFKDTVLKWDERKGNEEDREKYHTTLKQKMKATIEERVTKWVKRKEEDETFQKILDNVFTVFENEIKSIDAPFMAEVHESCRRLSEETLKKYCNEARMDEVSQDEQLHLMAYKEKLRKKMENAISQKISEWCKREQAKHEQRRIENIFDEAYGIFIAELMTVDGNTEETVTGLCKYLREKTLHNVDANLSKEEISENELLTSLKMKLLASSMDDDIKKKMTEWTRIQEEKDMQVIRDKMKDAQDDFITKIESIHGTSEDMIERLHSTMSIETLQNFKDVTENKLSLETSYNRLATYREELRETLHVVAKKRVYEWKKEQDMRRRMIKANLEKRNAHRLESLWLELMNEKVNSQKQTKSEKNRVESNKGWREIKSLSLNNHDMQDIYKKIQRIVLCEYWSTNLQVIEKSSMKYLNTKLLDTWVQITNIVGLQSHLSLYPFPDVIDKVKEGKIARYIGLVNEVVAEFHRRLTEDQDNGKFPAGEDDEEVCRNYADIYLSMHFDYINKIFPDLTEEYKNLKSLLQDSEKNIVLMRNKIQEDFVAKLSIVMRKFVSTIVQELNEKLAVHHYAREVLRSEYMKQCDDAYQKMYEKYIGGCRIQEITTSVYEAAEVQKNLDDLLKRNEDNKDNTIFPDEDNISTNSRNVFQRILDFFRGLFG